MSCRTTHNIFFFDDHLEDLRQRREEEREAAEAARRIKNRARRRLHRERSGLTTPGPITANLKN